jgi:hypothetical protein
MAINPSQPIRGSAVRFKLVINSPVAQVARCYVNMTNGTPILPQVDMKLLSPGVYYYDFQTTAQMPLTTYNVYCVVSLNGISLLDKNSFILLAN